MPQRELILFENSINRARDMMGLASSLSSTTSGVMDLSDIHRAAFVQGVSAFDTLLHEEIRVRILHIFTSGSPMPAALQRFKVTLASTQIATATSDLSWLDTEIRDQLSLLSFQKPDKIADGVRLISDVQLWKELAIHLGQGAQDGVAGDQILKRRMTLIADRRNTIVHESDLDPTPPGDVLYPMTRSTVDDALTFLDRIARGIQVVT